MQSTGPATPCVGKTAAITGGSEGTQKVIVSNAVAKKPASGSSKSGKASASSSSKTSGSNTAAGQSSGRKQLAGAHKIPVIWIIVAILAVLVLGALILGRRRKPVVATDETKHE